MESFFRAANSVLIVFFLTALGYFCAARGWMDRSAKQFIGKFLMNIGIPGMCIYEMSSNFTRAQVAQSLLLLLIAFASLTATLAAAYLVMKIFRRKMPQERTGVFLTMCCVSNAIFIGYTMCTEIFGAESAPYIMIFYLANTTMIQLVCHPLIRKTGPTQAGKAVSVGKLLKTPAILGILSGYTIVLCGISLPHVITKTLMYTSRTVTPMALLFTGYIIYDTGLKNLRITGDHILVLLFRFLICPAIGMGLCTLFGIHGMGYKVLVAELAMPVLTMSVVYASAYGADEQFAAEGAVLSTLASFLTVPLLMLIL